MQKLAVAITAASALLAPLSRSSVEAAPLRDFQSDHAETIAGQRIHYKAEVEEFIANDSSGNPAASLITTSYIRERVPNSAKRPVIFLFNGGPSSAAVGVHEQFGPLQKCRGVNQQSRPCVSDNPNSLLDVADLIIFDPVETGFSRMLPGGNRSYFYSVNGDADSLAQLVISWIAKHHRETSPRYLLGESYGSVRTVVAADLLRRRGAALNGAIILGDSIFLMETSRRTHNIISTAVSLPLLAMTAAYHNKADKHGKDDAAFLDEVYGFGMSDYLLALSKGYELGETERQKMSARLEQYTGIAANYFLEHGLAISKQDFNRTLLPGRILDANDTRVSRSVAEAKVAQAAELANDEHFYKELITHRLAAPFGGMSYQPYAPESGSRWDWGSGCNDYLKSAGLCDDRFPRRNIFMDYDFPEVLKQQFIDPRFKAMIVAGYYDGLSSIGTHRYLKAQLGYPATRFEIHEFAGGHMTAADPVAQPKVMKAIRSFLAK